MTCTECGTPLSPTADPRRIVCGAACKQRRHRRQRGAERARRADVLALVAADPAAPAHLRDAARRALA